MSDPQRPQGLQPSRLLHPWDFPGKSTGVGCHCLLRPMPLTVMNLCSFEILMANFGHQKFLLISQSFWASTSASCCTPVCSSPKTWLVRLVLSHVQLFVTPWTAARQDPLSMEILQVRILEWVAVPSSRESSQLGSPALQVDSLPSEPPGKPKNTGVGSLFLLQGNFPTQESNWGLLHCRQILYQLSYQGSPGKAQERLSHCAIGHIRSVLVSY